MSRFTFLAVLLVASSAGTAAAADAVPPSTLNRHLPDWIRLSGELRAREEGFFGNRFVFGQDDMYLLQRVRLAVQLRPLSWLQFYVQGQDARVSFTDRVSAAPPLQDSADLRQLWVQVGESEKGFASLRVGRQELAFGEERLVGAANWGNVSRTFDAARLSLHAGRVRLDAFAASVVVPRDHEFDRHTDGDNLHGAYAAIQSVIPAASLEPFAFWHVAPRVRAETGTQGRLSSKTLGIRWNGQLPHAWEYTTEMALQRGAWGVDDISAWAGLWRIGRLLSDRGWKPRLRLELNHASGDEDPVDARHGTFDVLYPTPHDKYGLADQVGWKNVNHIGVIAEFRPRKNLVIQGKAHDWWLASSRDGLYNAGGLLLVRDPTGQSGTHVGEELDFQAIWTPRAKVQVAGGVGHIFPGQFLRNTTPGAGYTFPYVALQYGF